MIRTIVESIFASRYPVLRIDAKTIDTWVLEISAKKYSEEVLSKCSQVLINDDTIKLTIAGFIAICENIKKEIVVKLPTVPLKHCPYCQNTGLTVFSLMFDEDGYLVSTNTVMNCKCGSKSIGSLTKCYEFAPRSNKVFGGYIKVYTYPQLQYTLMKIKKNGNKDVVVDFSNNNNYLAYKKDYDKNLLAVSVCQEIE